jgi:protein gp37
VAFFYKQKADPARAGGKLGTPELDGQTWQEYPALDIAI